METYRKPRILITFVEAGMGHIVSAQAISDSLKKKYGDKMEIIEAYMLRDSENPVLPKFEEFLVKNTQLYSKIPAFGDIQFASMHILGAQNTLKLIHNTTFHASTLAMIEEYKKYKPDVIICTHFFLLFTAVEYRRKFNPDVPVVAYCPDNDVHGWWDNRADVIYTNNPLATKQAYDLKFRNGHVREVFYPTRADVVESNEGKESYREKFGIPQDKFAVVIADGVYAKAKLRKVCKELLKTDVPITICVLAGKNEKLKRLFDEIKPRVKPNITLLTFGFIKEAPQLYGACDLFITKAGPNAVLDSVMMGTPILTDYCATPSERATKKLFVEHMFCGYHFVSPRRIRKQVEKLVEQPELLQKIRETLSFFDKSRNGADEIADDIAEILWNRRERMEKILREEKSVISEFFNEKAEIKRAEAKKKIEKIQETTAKRAEKFGQSEKLDGETAEKLSQKSAKRIEVVNARTEKQIEKIDCKTEKVIEKVYEGKASRYSAKAILKKVDREQDKRETDLA